MCLQIGLNQPLGQAHSFKYIVVEGSNVYVGSLNNGSSGGVWKSILWWNQLYQNYNA